MTASKKPIKPRPRRNSRSGQSESLADQLESHRISARRSALRMLQSPASSFVTVFVVAVSLLLPALLFSLNSNLTTLLSGFQESAQLTLYLRNDTTDAKGTEVSERLLSRMDISAAHYTSPDEGLQEFGEISGLQALVQELPTNPLPGAIVLTPVDVSPDAVDRLVAELEGLPEVDIIQVDSRWLQRLAAISNLVRALGRVLSLIVILGLFFVVGNTIKLAVENRKDEIQVIKLVGGSDLFAARPFLYSGLFYGVAGGILAAILQVIVLIAFNSNLEELLQLYESDFQLRGFGFRTALLVILAGGIIGWAAALLASLRHIRSISP